MTPISRRGDLHNPASRLNLKAASKLIDESPRHFKRRSSSAWAKSARELQNLIGPLELSNIPFELPDPRGSGCTTGTRLTFSLGNPVLQCLGRAANLLGHQLTLWQPIETHGFHAARRPYESLALAAPGYALFVCS